MKIHKLTIRILAIVLIGVSVSSCDPQVYGSVGVSSWGGGYGSPRVGGSISIGGCLTCR